MTSRHPTRLETAVALAALLVCGATTAQATGTVTGRITLNGTATPAEVVQVATNPEVCGAVQRTVDLVGADGGVHYAVVKIIGAPGTAPTPPSPPEIDQRGCGFTPHVVIVGVGRELDVLNNDGILHNFHTAAEKNPPMNLGQPGYLTRMTLRFNEEENVRVGCDVHWWMSSVVVVTDTPFVAVTDERGTFSIPQVPAGQYRVSVWHEQFGETVVDVTVADGTGAVVNAQLNAN